MKDFIHRWELEIIMLLGSILLILTIVLIIWGANHLRTDALNQLGYETKVINLDCYAKYHDRWLSCDAVINNQVQITN